MRLICGIVRLDGAPAQAGTLAAMLEALTAPGLRPRISSRVEGTAALGVLDFASDSPPDDARPGALPQGPDGSWLAADLRLDRPRELARTLGLPAGTAAQPLALAAMARWGEDLPDRLDGDFALAAWTPAQQQLICARDIMGVRPLCYAHLPGRLLAFASLPRGLHASGVVPRQLDPVALGRVLLETHPRDGLTGFAAISWLAAGHALTLNPQGVRIHRAWQAQASQVGRGIGSAAESADILRTLVEEAVACRLPASGPVAAHLSGGLDSSALAVMAARQLRARHDPLYAFSLLGSPAMGPLLDEREFVEAVLAQEPDIRWSPAYLPPLDQEGVFEPDLALAGPLASPEDEICAAAAAAGNQLILSGTGGDEGATYNGLGILAAMLRKGCWGELQAELAARARRQHLPWARVAASQLLAPLLPDWLMDLRRRSHGQSRIGDRHRNSLAFLQPALAAQVGAIQLPGASRGSSPQDRIRLLAQSNFDGRANRWSILAARHGLAFSFPLADRRILDFALSLPVEQLAQGGFSRQPFRHAMGGILPEAIRWRTTKFVPFPDMGRNLVAAAPGLLAQLSAVRSCALASGMFDMDAIQAAISAAAQYPVAQDPAHLTGGQPQLTRALRNALHAVRALILARYVARLA